LAKSRVRGADVNSGCRTGPVGGGTDGVAAAGVVVGGGGT